MKNEKSERKKRSRAKYACPEPLKNLIAAANTLGKIKPISDYIETISWEDTRRTFSTADGLQQPPDPKVMARRRRRLGARAMLNEMSTRNPEALIAFFFVVLMMARRTNDPNIEMIKVEFGERIRTAKTNPNEFKRWFIFTLTSEPLIDNLVMHYDALAQDIDDLLELVRRLEQTRSENRQEVIYMSFTPVNVAVVDNERIYVHEPFSLFRSAITDIDPNRLLTCKICNRIFWAKRRDSKTCSPKCANTLRVRRFRSMSGEDEARRNETRR